MATTYKHILIASCSLILICCSCTDNAQTGFKKLVWSDEFNSNGLPDSTKWSYEEGNGCPKICGWGNNEKEYYTVKRPENARVENGRLIIEARKENFQGSSYTSARLVSKNKGDWKYGRFEIKAKISKGKGTWPAVWMMPTKWEYGDWPHSGEIDIMENVGFKPDSIFCSIHTESFNHVIGTQKTKGIKINKPYTSFHLYVIEWDQQKINFLLDDSLVFSYANSGNGYKEWPFDKRFHLLLNIAVGGNWGGQHGVDECIFPATMFVDYVRIYQKNK